jgi:hypothetical protein
MSIGVNLPLEGIMGKSGWSTAKRFRLGVLVSMVAATVVFPYQLHAQDAEVTLPSLDLILNSLEQTAEQNPALSRPYEVRREYKVFREDNPMPVSDIMAEISFSPPETKTFEITKAEGNPRGKKIVTTILKQEIDSAKDGHRGDITRANYDFAFLREQNFGVVPEYVLHIIPKRKEKGLLLGDIWVDAKTFRIRQIVGVPLKNPSIWVEDLHITVQFAEVNTMWLPVSVDAIATIHFLGIYTLSGLDVLPPAVASSALNP